MGCPSSFFVCDAPSNAKRRDKSPKDSRERSKRGSALKRYAITMIPATTIPINDHNDVGLRPSSTWLRMATTRIFPRLGFVFVSCAYLTLSVSFCNSLHFWYSFTPLYTFDIPLRFFMNASLTDRDPIQILNFAIDPMHIYHLNFCFFVKIQTKVMKTLDQLY